MRNAAAPALPPAAAGRAAGRGRAYGSDKAPARAENEHGVCQSREATTRRPLVIVAQRA